MLGLAFLFMSALSIALYVLWLRMLYRVGAFIARQTASLLVRVPVILAGVLLALLPWTGALVRPLLEKACDDRGGIVQLADWPKGETSLQVTGSHYGGFDPLELFATREVSSIHLGQSAEYGSARTVANAAEAHDGRAFNLRPSNPDDVACGPYYDHLHRNAYSPKGYAGLCLAYSLDPLPPTYLRLSKLQRRERSWRTAFYAIDWTGITLERVSQGGTSTILEAREFEHGGTSFPLLLGVTAIGKTSCRAGKDVQAIIESAFAAKAARPEPVTFSKEELGRHIAHLEERFWGFPLPDGVQTYDVFFTDFTHARSGQKLEVALNVHRHDRPVLLSLGTNVDVKWLISRPSEDQVVLVKPWTAGENPVEGVPGMHVLRGDRDTVPGSPLAKFYLRKVSFGAQMRSINEKRFCKVATRATGARTTIEIDGCPGLAASGAAPAAQASSSAGGHR